MCSVSVVCSASRLVLGAWLVNAKNVENVKNAKCAHVQQPHAHRSTFACADRHTNDPITTKEKHIDLHVPAKGGDRGGGARPATHRGAPGAAFTPKQQLCESSGVVLRILDIEARRQLREPHQRPIQPHARQRFGCHRDSGRGARRRGCARDDGRATTAERPIAGSRVSFVRLEHRPCAAFVGVVEGECLFERAASDGEVPEYGDEPEVTQEREEVTQREATRPPETQRDRRDGSGGGVVPGGGRIDRTNGRHRGPAVTQACR